MKKLSEDDLRLINKFMSDDLSHEETLSFNRRVEDPDFNQELKFQRGIARSINDVQRNQLREELRRQLDRPTAVEKKKLLPVLYWTAAAAALVIITMAGIYFFSQVNTNEKLFTTYYKLYPAPVVTRGNTVEQPKEIEQALAQYRMGDFAAGAKSLEALLGNNIVSNREELKLLLGNCYLQINENAKAQQLFQEVLSSDNTSQHQHAAWYSALTLLKSNKPEQALPLFNTISQSNSIYRQQALNLAETLNSNN